MEKEKINYFKTFWHLCRGYWKSEEKWKAVGLLGVVIALNLAAVYLLVLLNDWYNTFYNALQGYEEDSFLPLVGQFTGLAMLYIIIAVYAIYIRQMLQIKWRSWMTDRYLTAWLADQSYYRLQVLGSDTDNPDQRISEDINQFVSLSLQLFVGLLKELTTLGAFSVVLWNLSGAFTVPIGGHEFVIYGYMFWFSLIYSVLGTGAAHLVGRKLIGLDFDQQRYEADFRFNMMRVRENSESIAFYRGEAPEGAGFRERFGRVIGNFWQLMRQTKLLNFYINGYAQLAVIVPIVMAAPQYFAGTIALGGFMQTLSAFGRVQDALSYFVTSYDSIAQLAAVIRRLGTFSRHMEEVSEVANGVSRKESGGETLAIRELTVALPDGRELVQGLEADFAAGSRVLVMGSSGCGKSTLLRTLAGIWPYGKGGLALPAEQVLFLPQRPYLPLGSLEQALSYPGEVTADRETLQGVLEKVGLASLTDKLGETDDWSRILSLGEQQRLAFARVLLAKPLWVFLDEATSALDEDREQEMYGLLKDELPDLGIMSVGHRSTLLRQHEEKLLLDGQGGWQLSAI